MDTDDRCPAHDPILQAGFLTCGECREVSYALDASWITGTWILAVFDQIHKPWCPGRRQPQLVLVDMASKNPQVPLVARPLRCKGTTRHGAHRGQRCKNPAAARSEYCVHHDPARHQSAGSGGP